MKKFTKEQTHQAMKLAHVIRSEAAQNLNCKKSDIDFSICLKQAYSQIQEQQEITYQEWFNYYQENKKYFYGILYKKYKGEDTEDILQLTHQKIMEYFNRKGTIKFIHRHKIFEYMVLDSIKKHNKIIKNSSHNPSISTGFNNQQERIIITDDTQKQNIINLKITLQEILTSKQLEIVSLLEEGYGKTEISSLLGISREAVYKSIRLIRKKLIAAGIYKTETA